MDRIKQELLEDELTIKLSFLKFKILLLQQQIGTPELDQPLPSECFVHDEIDYDSRQLIINNNNTALKITALEKTIREKRKSLISGVFEVLRKDHKLKLKDEDRDFPIVKKFIFRTTANEASTQHQGTCKLRGTAGSFRREPDDRDTRHDPPRHGSFL